MASYEKVIKSIIEKFQNGLSPLGQISQITHNQEVLIAQTQQIIDLLTREFADRDESSEQAEVPKESSSPSEIGNEENI